MKRLLTLSCAVLCAVLAPSTSWAETAELTLLSPLDETRGWCVDLFAHRQRAMPQGGFQGHNCFLYLGDGPTEDQGFDVNMLKEDGKLYLPYWDVCMTLHEPNARSFVAAETCSGERAQQFEFGEDGRVIAVAAPDLCLTLGAHSVPGGGRLAPVGTRPPANNEKIHIIRRLTFETCSPESAERQKWGLRNVYEPAQRSEPMRFLKPE